MPSSYHGTGLQPYRPWRPPARVPTAAQPQPEQSGGLLDFLNRYYDRVQSIVGGGSDPAGRPSVASSGPMPRTPPAQQSATGIGGLLGQFGPPQQPVKLTDDGFGNLLDEPTAKLINDIAHGTPDQAAALHGRIQDRFGADPRSAYFFHAAVNDMDAGYTPEEQQKYLGPIGDYRFRNDYMLFNALVGGALAGSTLPKATPARQGPGTAYQPPSHSYAQNPVAGELSRGLADPPRIVTQPPTVSSAGAEAVAGLNAPKSQNTTRYGIERDPRQDWPMFQDLWDQTGYAGILSSRNRSFIAQGRSPIVDEQWVRYFPEDAGLRGQVIQIHHIDASFLRLPWPRRRHLDAHMPGGTRWNPGGPGSAAPFYFDSPKGKR